MKITVTASFERDFRKLRHQEKEQVYEVLSNLPHEMGHPHRHTGSGIRKIHPSGIFEARIGLGLRIAFGLLKNEIILHRLGDHNTIQNYLKNL